MRLGFGNIPPFYSNTVGINNGPQTLYGDKIWTNVVADQGTLATWTPAAYLALTASTENPDINFNLARTVQFATGALTTQRAFRVQPPTYDAVGASVITHAVTLAVGGPPVATGNVTITNPWSATFGTPSAVSGASGVNNVGIWGAGNTNFYVRDTTDSTEFLVQAGGSVFLGTTTSTNLNLSTAGATRFQIASNGKIVHTPGTSASGVNADYVLTPAANTGMTNNAESNVWRIGASAGGVTRTWATGGTVTLQRDVLVFSTTLGTASATTFTDAATFAVSGPPVAGSGATITKAWGILCGTPEATNNSGWVNSIGLFGAGEVDVVIRNTTNDVEGSFGANSGNVYVGAYSGHPLLLISNSTTRTTYNAQGKQVHTSSSTGSGVLADWVLTPATSTGITNNAQSNVFRIDTATRTWATGATVTLQQDFLLTAQTLASAGSTTFTDAATLAVSGPPVAGSGATITRGYIAAFGTPAAVTATPANAIGIFGATTTSVIMKTVSGAEGLFQSAATNVFVGSASNHLVNLGANSTGRIRIDAAGDVVLNPTGSALATNATTLFTHIPNCAGTPTGVPAGLVTGATPMVFDTTGGKLWAYYGGAWHFALFT